MFVASHKCSLITFYHFYCIYFDISNLLKQRNTPKQNTNVVRWTPYHLCEERYSIWGHNSTEIVWCIDNLWRQHSDEFLQVTIVGLTDIRKLLLRSCRKPVKFGVWAYFYTYTHTTAALLCEVGELSKIWCIAHLNMNDFWHVYISALPVTNKKWHDDGCKFTLMSSLPMVQSYYHSYTVLSLIKRNATVNSYM